MFDQAHFGEPDASTALVRVSQTLFVASVPGLVAGVRALIGTFPTPMPRAAAIGQMSAYAGRASTFVGSLLSVARPSDTPWLNPLGSVLQSVGMLLVGSAILRCAALTGWRRYVPLLVGAWFFAHMPFQLAFFASPNGIPSHTLMMGVWGPLWALLGVALNTRLEYRALAG